MTTEAAPGPAPGIGVDLIEIERVERALDRYPRLARRLFTDGELRMAGGRRRPGPALAARFAAKEATMKALGRPLPPTEIEVIGGGGEAPRLRLTGRARRLAESSELELDVSLSHSRGDAVAVVSSRRLAR